MELNPCPFCPDGGDPYVKSDHSNVYNMIYATVGCKSCGVLKRVGCIDTCQTWEMTSDETREFARKAHAQVKQEAVEWWNGSAALLGV